MHDSPRISFKTDLQATIAVRVTSRRDESISVYNRFFY